MFTAQPKTLRRPGAPPARARSCFNHWKAQPWLEPLEDRVLLSAGDSLANAIPLSFAASQVAYATERLGSPTDQDFYQIDLLRSGNLSAQVDAGGAPVSLTLYDAQGLPIVRSDGASPSAGPFLVHGLTGGATYYLKVANLGGSESQYQLTTRFTPSDSQLATVPIGTHSVVIVKGDFNGDGLLDLATGNWNNADSTSANNVTIHPGNGDGTFQNAGAFDLGDSPSALVAADFNGDGRLDLAAGALGGDNVRVLLGNGDGTFQDFLTIAGPGGDALVAADFNADGRADLAVAISASNQLVVYSSNGDGTFQSGAPFVCAGVLSALAAGDFNADGRADLAVTDQAGSQVTLFLNQGDGTFQNAGAFGVGDGPNALTVGDFNGDGRLDLASSNIRGDSVTVLLGNGQGSLHFAGSFAVGDRPRDIETGDFNGDGRLDLAAVNNFSNSVTLLLGQGDGTFVTATPAAVDADPYALAVGDFDGDGRVDLATVNYNSQNLTVLLGNGDGTFPHRGTPNTTGQHPAAVVQGDFNGDGHLDLATANSASNDVTVLLGQGDGAFQMAGAFPVGVNPEALIAGDFNGDGRLDLATANRDSGDVSLLLGNGDGSFQDATVYPVPGAPRSLAIGDFNDDFNPDLAVALGIDGSSVVLLLGDGQGALSLGNSADVGLDPHAVVAGDFNGDGNLDLAVADYASHDATILLGDGTGNFVNTGVYPLAGAPIALVAGDFDGDTRVDLAFATIYYSSIAVLLNNGDGTFRDGGAVDPGVRVASLVTGDFDGDGKLDLASANWFYSYTYEPANSVTVFLGDGQGAFAPAGSFPAGDRPAALAVGDFNGDARLDLAAANHSAASVTALLGTGTGAFVTSVLAPGPSQSTPLIANLLGTPAADAVVLTETGRILFRRGLVDQPGAFAPPVVLNPDPSMAARDVALVQTTGDGWLVAALNSHTFTITLYQPRPDGTFTALPGPVLPAGFLPANLASADLTQSGLGALVISAAASDQIFVSLQIAPGIFGPVAAYRVGVNPSAIDLADLNDDSFRDIVVSSRFTGQISVLLNDGAGAFLPEERYRAAEGLYGLTPVNGTDAVRSLAGTNGIVSGNFDNRAGVDLVAMNSNALNLAVLSGTDLGGFLNPSAAQTVRTGSAPSAIVSGQFTTDDTRPDLAVLSKDTGAVSIYTGDGQGGFTRVFTIDAGNQPTGLASADVSRPGGGGPDGIADLLVGNIFGDLLILPGIGDGTFASYRRAGQGVSLAVATSATGRSTFYFGSEASDQLAFQSVDRGTAVVNDAEVFQDRSTGIQAPGPQTVVTVAGMQYLVVANSGGNELLIYTIGPDGMPSAASRKSYFTGTDPTALAVTNRTNDLNGDAIPDVVVANQGSNDVSVFLGKMVGGTWTLSYRPRQSSAGAGPSAIAIADVTGADGRGRPDGIADLLVTNAQSNNVSVLPNRGAGFFINQPAPDVLPFLTGAAPSLMFVGNFDGVGGLDLVTVNRGSNTMTRIANFASDPVLTTVAMGGTFPIAAVVADFNRNGISDLLVANVNDGRMELFSGGLFGFESAGSFSLALAPHLSDLALVAVGNHLDLYGSLAGQEVAVLLGSFGPPLAPPAPLPPSPGFPIGLQIDMPKPSTIAGDGGNVATPGATALNAHAEAVATVLTVSFVVNADSTNETSGAQDGPRTPSSILLQNLPAPGAPNEEPDAPQEEENNEPQESDDTFVALGLAEADEAFTLPPISLSEGSAQPVGLRSAPRPDSLDRMEIELEPRAADKSMVRENRPTTIGSSSPRPSGLAAFWLALPCLAMQLRDRLCDVGNKAVKRWRERGQA